MLAAHVMMSSPPPPPRAERPRSIVQGRKVANDATPWPELTNTHDDDKVKCVDRRGNTRKKRIGGKGSPANGLEPAPYPIPPKINIFRYPTPPNPIS